MTVQVYVWGNASGSGASTAVTITGGSLDSGTPEIFSGTCAALTNIAFSGETLTVTIENTADDHSLDYSLDAGGTFITLQTGQIAHETVEVTNILLQPTVGGTDPTYNITAALKP